MNLNSWKFLPCHLVDVRPWPFLTSVSSLGMTLGGVYWWHYKNNIVFLIGAILTLWKRTCWWKDVRKERWLGFHRRKVLFGLRIGMLYFILSEVFFFFSFFWSYFNRCWRSTDELGWMWPPAGFKGLLVDPFRIPLLNTIILLRSGVTVTYAHHMILKGSYRRARDGLILTSLLGALFLLLQLVEYRLRYYSVCSTTYGTVFFLLTGFHGTHVIIGNLFLIVCLFRFVKFDFKNFSHVGFECAAWYWHFVDVVWLFLFIFVYWYGFSLNTGL